jgi:hypothetical protein
MIELTSERSAVVRAKRAAPEIFRVLRLRRSIFHLEKLQHSDVV